MSHSRAAVLLDLPGLNALVSRLAKRKRVLGPVERDGAVRYEDVTSVDDLPKGWVSEQAGGHYRLAKSGEALFGYVIGPDSWKRFLHPPRQRIWQAEAGAEGAPPVIHPEPPPDKPMAFLGVRGCELAAIAVQDRVFMQGPYRDPHYAARRASAFIVAVNCDRAVSTCFCPSMGTGPAVGAGHDICLTEIEEGRTFLAEAGSGKGAELLALLPSRPAREENLAAATALTERAEAQIARRIDTKDLPGLLQSNPEHPRWDDVARRCLNCANCTMVCPTCFCTETVETSSLDGKSAARESRWASCFTLDFTHVHGGGPLRHSPKSRYRQWMTHKLDTWHDQFGQSGCTGCGRCITWCPVGIDITEEVAAIRREP
ncbi:4Fe-4S dicluster domain-containing protein [Ostreiculturibacter nitratireducens]|uniref:4Fe-4S dicluster domain-containing protein n=1 Tax=Ostreiculturibacter nitratireducens TaxID=3075226 RepID=UPI0031B5E2AB